MEIFKTFSWSTSFTFFGRLAIFRSINAGHLSWRHISLWLQQHIKSICVILLTKIVFAHSTWLMPLCFKVLSLNRNSDTHRRYFRVYVIKKTDMISIVSETNVNIELSFHAKITPNRNIDWYTPIFDLYN